ncbi:hypothetical protein BGX31_003512 [Mortierella sp. GBA43]|nr:hypothetical protein BGX31_003512 [Mortierella sp. GBA43]
MDDQGRIIGGGFDKKRKSSGAMSVIPAANNGFKSYVSDQDGYLMMGAQRHVLGEPGNIVDCSPTTGWEHHYYQRHPEQHRQLLSPSHYMDLSSDAYSSHGHKNGESTLGSSGSYWDTQRPPHHPTHQLSTDYQHQLNQYPQQHQNMPIAQSYAYQHPGSPTELNPSDGSVTRTCTPSSMFPSTALVNGVHSDEAPVGLSSSAIPMALSPTQVSVYSPLESQTEESTQDHNQSEDVSSESRLAKEDEQQEASQADCSISPPPLPLDALTPVSPTQGPSSFELYGHGHPAADEPREEGTRAAVVTATPSSGSELSSVDDWDDE